MNRIIVFVTFCLCIALPGSSQAQERTRKPAQRPGQTAPKKPSGAANLKPRPAGSPLKRLVGNWSTTFNILAGTLEFGVGSTVIEQADPDTISFSFSQTEMRQRQYVPGGPLVPEFTRLYNDFKLSRGGSPNSYLLSIKSTSGLSFEGFPLFYSAVAGFSGKDVIKAGSRLVLVTASITFSARGHDWSITEVGADEDGADKKVTLGYYSLAFSNGSANPGASSPKAPVAHRETAARSGSKAPTETELGSELLSAAGKGDTVLIKSLLDRKADPNVPGSQGETALMLVAREGDVNTSQLLLANRANPNAVNRSGSNALMIAAEEGHLEIVDALLAKGSTPDARDEDGLTALLFAIRNQRAEVVQTLLAHGSDVNAKDKEGMSAVEYALLHYDAGILQLLLDKGASLDLQGKMTQRALYSSTTQGYADLMNLLLDKGADPNAKLDGESLLASAVSSACMSHALKSKDEAGIVRVIKVLLDKGADPNSGDKSGYSLFDLAAEEGQTETVRLLIGAGADTKQMSRFGETALTAAARMGQFEVVKLLLEDGADPNKEDTRGNVALVAAAETRSWKIVILLLENGANPNAQGHGDAALIPAVEQQETAIVKALLEKGADPNLRGHDGQTPLEMAKRRKNSELVQLMSRKSHRKP